VSVDCLAQLSQENIINIFRFTDLKTLGRMASVCKIFARIQEDNSLWCDKIPRTVPIEPGYSMKERVVRYYDQVLLGKEWEDSQTFYPVRSQVRCRLSISQKTISALGYEFFDLCLLAMKHDRVRNGSFLVCVKSYVSPYRGEGFADPCVMIKDKKGSVVKIIDLEDHLHEVNPTGYPNSTPQLRQAFFDELCKYQSKETPYHEYRLDFTELAQGTTISPVRRAQLDQALKKIKKIEQDTKKLLNGE